MHILIATTGALPTATAVEFTRRLLHEGGRVTVTTVIEVPHSFLEELRSDRWLDEETSATEDALIDRYVEERGRRLTEPIVAGLVASGIPAEARYLDGEAPAPLISRLADEIDADLVIVGATRRIFDHSVWESVSSQLMAECLRPVLILPANVKEMAEAAAG